MRALLVVLDHVDTAPAVLAAAALVARRLGESRIDVLHVRAPADPSFMPTEEVMTPQRQAHFEAHEAARSAALRALFDAWQGNAGPADIGWQEQIGDKAAVVAGSAEKADLIVVGHARREPGDGKTAIEAALFAAGASVLLVAQEVPATLGEHVAVAWKPSATAERAVVAAAPLLRRAGRVTVLVGADAAGDRTPPEALVQTLAGLDRLPQTESFELASHAVGPLLLREAHRIGADLLVMGAYTQRRSVEALLGGATRDILAHADLPVFLHH
jgi:nucleotide-binding universal stress UspA family protein